MSEQRRDLVAFDASRMAYMHIIKQATEGTDWHVMPYDEEAFAIEDLASYPNPALAAVLSHSSYAYQTFPGKYLLELAASEGIPYAVIADENMRSKLTIVTPNLFIAKKPGLVVEQLSSWLVEISRT
jgi:hypothetical protein